MLRLVLVRGDERPEDGQREEGQDEDSTDDRQAVADEPAPRIPPEAGAAPLGGSRLLERPGSVTSEWMKTMTLKKATA